MEKLPTEVKNQVHARQHVFGVGLRSVRIVAAAVRLGATTKKGRCARNKRRLVCNSCEKNKLREKRQNSMSSSTKKKKAKTASKVTRKRELSKAVSNPKQTTATDSPEKKEIAQMQSGKVDHRLIM